MKNNQSYSIKLIKDSTDKDYLKSIEIYSQNTPIDIRTNTNEISYWVDNTNEFFKSYYFSLFLNERNIGFSMFSYLPRHKVLIIEYISVHEEFKKNQVYLSFLNLCIDYINEELNNNINYTISEISNKNDGKDIDEESKIFKNILSLESFGMIKALYITPPLNDNITNSSFKANLMIKSNSNFHSIPQDIYLKIIHSIYYDYFQNWYFPFWTKNNNDDILYKEELNSIYTQVKNMLQLEKEPLEIHNKNIEQYKNSGNVNTKNGSTLKLKPILILILVLFIAYPLIAIFYSYIFSCFKIEASNTMTNTLLVILGSVLTTIFNKLDKSNY